MQQRRRYRTLTLGLLSLGLLVGSSLMASPAQAATSNGPYYANPAWDQKLPATTRFVVLLDWSSQAVLDRETGLVWEQSPLTTFHRWDFSEEFSLSALVQCMNRTTGGRKGWRLPSVHELASLIELPPKAGLALPAGHPFTNVQAARYWSASTFAVDPAFAWVVNFGLGAASGLGKTGNTQVWCVRGGMNADAY
jgi:hypothetical protein